MRSGLLQFSKIPQNPNPTNQSFSAKKFPATMALPPYSANSSPPSATTVVATAPSAASSRPLSNPIPPPRPPNPALPQSLPQQQPIYHHHRHQVATPYPFRNLAPRAPSSTAVHPPNPVSFSGRGFFQKGPARPPADQALAIANPSTTFPAPAPAPRGALGVGSYGNSPHPAARAFGIAQSDHHQVQLMRPAHSRPTLVGPTGGITPLPPMVRGVSLPAYQKAVPTPASTLDGNGYKDLRDRSRDDDFVTVRDRKVRISDSSSLYSACRSWLRNGYTVEKQQHYMDGIRALPKPSPPPVPDAHSPAKPEANQEEEEEGSVEHLSPSELLQRHVRRAKRVRARLREERLQRIARYKTRLALLLPPLMEQQQHHHQFRDETAAGN